MTEEKSILLAIASRILIYPDEDFSSERAEMEEAVQDITAPDLKNAISKAMKPIYLLPLPELQELYVQTFDYKEKTGLYLTAHEMGDSRKRGSALIELQQMIQEAGFVQTNEELADYIPMLLEFLAVAPEDIDCSRLRRRLAFAIDQILSHLPQENPYAGILQVLMTFIFDSPTAAEIAEFKKEHEKADLDPLPYPLLYQ